MQKPLYEDRTANGPFRKLVFRLKSQKLTFLSVRIWNDEIKTFPIDCEIIVGHYVGFLVFIETVLLINLLVFIGDDLIALNKSSTQYFCLFFCYLQ